MIWSTYARPDEGRELPPSKSSYLDDEAQIVRLATDLKMESWSQFVLHGFLHLSNPKLREAARRELLRRSLFGGKG